MPVRLDPSIQTPSHRRHAFYKRVGVFAGFAALLIVLAANVIVVRRQLGVQVGNQASVNQAQQVLLEMEKAASILKDAETGQRGYLYTGDPQYLEPYNLAITQVETHLASLESLTAGNPRQFAHVLELHSLARTKLAELAETISLFRSGRPDEARALVRTNRGRATMDSIRGLINQMEVEESSLGASRTAAYLQSVQLTIFLIYLPTLVAALGLALLAYYILREMHQREMYLHEIHRREEWYRTTLTSIGDAVIATDEHGKVTFLNPEAEALTGISLALARGMDITEIFPVFNELTHMPAENPVRRVMEAGQTVALANHSVLMRSDGTNIPIEDSAAPIRDDHGNLVGVVLVFRDVSHERKSLEILRRTEKLAAAARLSASIAHEINNPLEAVCNLIYLAKLSPDVPASIVQTLYHAELELERVAHITRQSLGFYRESSAPVLIQIPALIESVLTLYSNKLTRKNIRVERHIGDCPPILGVTGELKQVVSNLIANAADAVGHDGIILIETHYDEGPGGGVAHLVIADNGPGIAAEDIDRLFEPFFTTKKDVGTGLGLWVSKEIVERHSGTIQVQPQHEGLGGAAFTIVLPCNPDLAAGATDAAAGTNGSAAAGVRK
jgi:PAS domain S-box-containing protein